MAAARKVALFRREIHEWISPPAFEILLGAAEVLAEGSFDGAPGPEQSYLASIQIQVSLPACAEYIRDPLDAAAARRLTEMIRQDRLIRELLHERARREAERAAGCALHELQVEIDTSHRGERLLVSMDVEARVRPRSAGRVHGAEHRGEHRGARRGEAG
jgi:hypothetical protein